MPYNLIHERWIPVRTAKGQRQKYITPWEIADPDDPPLALDAVRPDFNGALIQFLIGLTQTCFVPANGKEWRDRLTTPPTPDVLREAFSNYEAAFNLDGDGPRFMQDRSVVDGDMCDISGLLIDTPGEQASRRNSDLWVKRGLVPGLCPECLAATLFTLQSNAPEGGRGYYTSLRCGGPLTTIVLGGTLLETVWLNVLVGEAMDQLGNMQDEGTFPWIRGGKASQEAFTVTPLNAPPCRMFWGCPRRIWLEPAGAAGRCAICGRRSPGIFAQYRRRPGGTKHEGWVHSLSPCYRDADGAVRTRRPPSGGMGYRHWSAWIVGDEYLHQSPAPAVQAILDRQGDEWGELSLALREPRRLWAFGYEMDSMKARSWQEGLFPLPEVQPAVKGAYSECARRLVKAADRACGVLRTQVRNAWVGEDAEAKGAWFFVDSRFWSDTEADFYRMLDAGHRCLVEGGDLAPVKARWLASVRAAAVAIFEDVTQTRQITVTNPRRVAEAYRALLRLLADTNDALRKILDLPLVAVTKSGHGKQRKKK